MPNIVYILTNEAMPGLVKIGFTSNLEDRLRELSSATNIPLPFECFFAAEVDDNKKLERILHQIFSENRVNPKREFFRVDPEKVFLAISIGEYKKIDIGDSSLERDDADALRRAKARRKNIKLAALGINPGMELTFSRDPGITAKVVNGNKVDFNGETMSLSQAAIQALKSSGTNVFTANGSYYWTYDGESLLERRDRMEAEQFDEEDDEE